MSLTFTLAGISSSGIEISCPVSSPCGGYTMKGNMEEHDLLREYVEQHSEEAFAKLVGLHLDLVHSTARRLVQDPDLANDVCQSVFLLLARKAAAVRKAEALAGWLYRATCFEAKNLIRTEQRRRARESEAMRRSELDNDPAPPWSSVSPLVEDAMSHLKALDQNALLLRFFENKPLAEVGRALGLTEEAARKRVSRSLDQLQGYFQKRGIGIASGSLASLLAACAVEAAPPGLAASVSTTALAAGAATGAAGYLTTLSSTLLMTKTTGTILTVLVLGAVITPILLKKGSPPASQARPNATTASVASAPTGTGLPAQSRVARSAGSPVTGTMDLLGRVAALPALTADQIENYVERNKRNAESLLAAYRSSTNLAYLTEAAQRFPADPDVQYAVVAARAFPQVQRQWIEAYKSSSPENALPWYFSALEYYRGGDNVRAVQDLMVASRKSSFRADLAPTLQATEELHISAGRAADEARIAAFQASAQVPHLTPMRELAKAMQTSIDQYRQQGDPASAEQLAGAGLVLGGHLSAGAGSQTLINQLVGIAIEQKFLEQLNSAGKDPFGRPVAEVKSIIENHRNALREHMKSFNTLIAGLDDTELANYMERVKLYGEEAALVWMKAKHGGQ